MKRVVWLVLAVFCAALGQVQAVDLGAKAKACACCHPDACGKPGCCPPPSTTVPALEAAEVVEVAPAASRLAPRAHEWALGFCFSLVALTETSRKRAAPAVERAPAASVPLFTAHCSRLI
jgi:hypothetical protein